MLGIVSLVSVGIDAMFCHLGSDGTSTSPWAYLNGLYFGGNGHDLAVFNLTAGISNNTRPQHQIIIHDLKNLDYHSSYAKSTNPKNINKNLFYKAPV